MRGELLWEPSEEAVRRAKITEYQGWLGERGKRFSSYEELRRWSVDELEGFWATIWEYFRVAPETAYSRVLSSEEMPGARWFEGAKLNYAERLFRERRPGPAVFYVGEDGQREVSWEELRREVGSVSAALREMGVEKGDTVAGYVSNCPEALVAFLSAASIGAVWSSCSPEFGVPSVVDRFEQITPKVLFATDGYRYGGKEHDRTKEARSIAGALPGEPKTVVLNRSPVHPSRAGEKDWEDVVSGSARLEFEPVDSSHPLWVLYSSGTTGLPKAIVQGHAGILVEHLKALGLHNDLGPEDRFFWYTTTGWMMWNYLAGGLLLGAAVVLSDASAGYPDLNSLWEAADGLGVTFLGVGAAFVEACMKAGTRPRDALRLKALRGVGSTGSPLSPEAFEWLYSGVKEDLWVDSLSGGTDVCTAFVGGCPTLPVHSGEIQCRMLGAPVEAYDEGGKPVIGKTGELVLTKPMPSMPLYFWGDDDGTRYLESYFSTFPGVWRHGDWVEVTERGTCVISGRSDATIKRMGVRMGTSEIYRVVESVPEVVDSLVVEVEEPRQFMPLFVVLRPGVLLDAALAERIRAKVRSDLSPRHVPDEVLQVEAIPRTLSGKKLEVPVRRILMGVSPEAALNRGSLSNPDSLEPFLRLAERLKGDGKV